MSRIEQYVRSDFLHPIMLNSRMSGARFYSKRAKYYDFNLKPYL